jgi:hypothetical protein
MIGFWLWSVVSLPIAYLLSKPIAISHVAVPVRCVLPKCLQNELRNKVNVQKSTKMDRCGTTRWRERS